MTTFRLGKPREILGEPPWPASQCSATVYSPDLYVEPHPVADDYQEKMICQAGVGESTALPFFVFKESDRLTVYRKYPTLDGPWVPLNGDDGTNIAICNRRTPWGRGYSPAFLRRHPEIHWGSTGGPQTFSLDGQAYECVHAATVGDPSGTTKRQFAIYWQHSFDFRNWTLRHMGRDHPNLAVRHALLWFGQFTGASDYPGEQGVTGALPLYSDGYLYFMIRVWVRGKKGEVVMEPLVTKNGLVRTRDRGVTCEIWMAGETWIPVVNGEVPDEYVYGEWEVGNPHPWPFSQIMHTPASWSDKRYTGVFSGNVTGDGPSLWFAFTDDLKDWPAPAVRVEFPHPIAGFDGASFKGGRMIFASYDRGLITNDPTRYGEQMCPDSFAPESLGRRIYEAAVEVVT